MFPGISFCCLLVVDHKQLVLTLILSKEKLPRLSVLYSVHCPASMRHTPLCTMLQCMLVCSKGAFLSSKGLTLSTISSIKCQLYNIVKLNILTNTFILMEHHSIINLEQCSISLSYVCRCCLAITLGAGLLCQLLARNSPYIDV